MLIKHKTIPLLEDNTKIYQYINYINCFNNLNGHSYYFLSSMIIKFWNWKKITLKLEKMVIFNHLFN